MKGDIESLQHLVDSKQQRGDVTSIDAQNVTFDLGNVINTTTTTITTTTSTAAITSTTTTTTITTTNNNTITNIVIDILTLSLYIIISDNTTITTITIITFIATITNDIITIITIIVTKVIRK